VTERFPTPGPVLLDLRIPAGAVEVAATETDETEVSVEPLNGPARDRMDEFTISLDGDRLRVEAPEERFRIGRSPEYAVAVRCPAGSRARLRSASADLSARGRLGALEVKTASGDVTAGEVEGDARVESASSDVRLDAVGGETLVQTASGDLELGRAGGPVKVNSVSGDVRLREAHARTQVQTVSGDLRIDLLAGGSLDLNAVSGDVDVAVVPGAAVWLDVRSLSGDTHSELDAGGEPGDGEAVIEIKGKTVSGDVRIRRASA
jgi:hypothetical protein